MRRAQLRLIPRGFDDGLVVDLFAGGGGASTGIEAALGRPVDVALNHDATAIATHTRNHPEAMHLTSNVWRVKPLDVTGGRPVSLLWASPDCRHFSIAKGDVPKSKKVRSLANAVVRWAKEVRPRVICLENVREFLTWGPLCKRSGKPIKARAGESFLRWRRGLERLGYVVEHRILDASHYGAPTRRKRLFVVARCDGEPISWPEPTHGPGRLPFHTAAECIDWSLPTGSIFPCVCKNPVRGYSRKRRILGLTGHCLSCGGRRKPLAEKTMWRIAQGIRRFVLENPRPFVVKVNHGKHEARGEPIDGPLSTVTATRRGHALVVPTLQTSGFGERPGQAARVPGLDVPLTTVVADGQKHALAAAFLAKHYGDPNRKGGGGVVIGSELAEPVGTVTARDHHSFAAVTLSHVPRNERLAPWCRSRRRAAPDRLHRRREGRRPCRRGPCLPDDVLRQRRHRRPGPRRARTHGPLETLLRARDRRGRRLPDRRHRLSHARAPRAPTRAVRALRRRLRPERGEEQGREGAAYWKQRVSRSRRGARAREHPSAGSGGRVTAPRPGALRALRALAALGALAGADAVPLPEPRRRERPEPPAPRDPAWYPAAPSTPRALPAADAERVRLADEKRCRKAAKLEALAAKGAIRKAGA